jgi:hypothetical protein
MPEEGFLRRKTRRGQWCCHHFCCDVAAWLAVTSGVTSERANSAADEKILATACGSAVAAVPSVYCLLSAAQPHRLQMTSAVCLRELLGRRSCNGQLRTEYRCLYM